MSTAQGCHGEKKDSTCIFSSENDSVILLVLEGFPVGGDHGWPIGKTGTGWK